MSVRTHQHICIGQGREDGEEKEVHQPPRIYASPHGHSYACAEGLMRSHGRTPMSMRTGCVRTDKLRLRGCISPSARTYQHVYVGGGREEGKEKEVRQPTRT